MIYFDFWRDWYAFKFGFSTNNLMIQSSSFAESACIENNIVLISKLECWWTKFNVELSLIKLNSKVLTIALRTTKLTCKVECWSLSSQMLHSQVECCDLLWFVAGMELHKFIQLFLESFWQSCKRQSRNALCFREIWHEESSVKSIDEKATKNKCESYSFGIYPNNLPT